MDLAAPIAPARPASDAWNTDLLDALPGIVWEADGVDQRMTFVGRLAREITGYEPEAWLADPRFWELHIHPDDVAEAYDAVGKAILGAGSIRIEYRFRVADGTYRWFLDAIRTIADAHGGRRLVGLMLDVTDEHRDRDPFATADHRPAAPEAGLHKTVLDNLSDGVYYVDQDRRITYWNHGAERMTGVPVAAAVGRQCFDDLLNCVDDDGHSLCATCPMTLALGRGLERQHVMWLRQSTGGRVPVLMRANPIRNRVGRVIGAVETLVEPTAAPAPAVAMPGTGQDPYADAVTGLPDWRLATAIATMRKGDLDRHWLPFGLLLIELDHVPQIVAMRGQAAVDLALRAIADMLRGTLRTGDSPAHWNPTTFAVVAAFTEMDGLGILAERVLRLVRELRVTAPDGSAIAPRVSIGGTLGSRGETVPALVSRAEQALAAARAGGHDRVILLAPSHATQDNRMLGVKAIGAAGRPRG